MKAYDGTPELGFSVSPDWTPQELEERLCEELQHYELIGQLPLEETDFRTLVEIMRRVPLKNIPPATFITAMVFCARYCEENERKFWQPFREMVIDCGSRKCVQLFQRHKQILERQFGFEFPTREGYNDVVRPIYYQAIIPAYLQDDFARWLVDKQRSFQQMAQLLPEELARELDSDSSLNYVAPRLRSFIRDADTQEAAVRLIQTLAEAARLYLAGETAENITELLISPIERDLWNELVKALAEKQQRQEKRAHRGERSRIEWVWDLEYGEIVLRLSGGVYKNRPEECRWVAAEGKIRYEEVIPWYNGSNKTWFVDHVYLQDISDNGKVELLDGQGNILFQDEVPPFPAHDPLLVFRLVEQETKGVLIPEPARHLFTDGRWLLCTKANVRLEKDNFRQESLPSPLDTRGYASAYMADLKFPFTYYVNGEEHTLRPRPGNLGQPYIASANDFGQVDGLAPHTPPTFFMRKVIRLVLPHSASRRGQSLVLRRGDEILKIVPLHRIPHEQDEHTLRISHLIPEQPGPYAIKLFRNLKPVLPEPLHFNLLPARVVLRGLSPDRYYSPGDPPMLTVVGVPFEDILVPEKLAEKSQNGNSISVTWKEVHDGECKVGLRFGDSVVQLAWPVRWVGAWLEGAEQSERLTLAQLAKTMLHVRGQPEQRFVLALDGTNDRRWESLDRRGKRDIELGRSPLMDMLKEHAQAGNNPSVSLHIGEIAQKLFILWRKPEISSLKIDYLEEDGSQAIWVRCKAQYAPGTRFTLQVRSLRDRDHVIPLGETEQLEDVFVEHTLADGYYRLEILCDDEPVALPPENAIFYVGEPDVRVSTGALDSELLFEWLTRPIEDLPHASRTYPLAQILTTVHDKQKWLEENGWLPAWAVTGNHVLATVVTLNKRIQLQITPQLVFDRAQKGKGFVELQPYYEEHKPLRTYVRWGADEFFLGIPNKRPGKPFAELDELDLLPVYLCQQCNHFFGSEYETTDLNESTLRVHAHGRDKTTFYDVIYSTQYTYNRRKKKYASRNIDFKTQAYISPNSEKLLEMRSEYHPQRYADPNYTESLIRRTAQPPATEYVLASPDHYRAAAYDWGTRYAQNPRAFRHAVWPLLQLLELQVTNEPTHPAHAAFSRFFTHAFARNGHDRDPLFLLIPAVLLLAMILRAEAYQTQRPTRHPYSSAMLIPTLDAAQMNAPELLGWALMWTELFFEHAI